VRVHVDGYVWLPTGSLTQNQKNNLKNALTVWPSAATGFPGKTRPAPIMLYKEQGNRLGVAREFFRQFSKDKHEEVVNVSDGEPMSDFISLMRFEGPFAEQGKAIERMMRYTEEHEWGGFLLKAGCGFGKTNTALEFARRLGRRTLILVHKEFFLRQWKERIEDFFPGARIGIIQGPKCDVVGKDFVIGMMQSLAADDGTKYPEEIYRSFGLVISDECHRIGAQTWSNLVPKFASRYRLGLTATPRRKDSAENVFKYHLGEILYSATTRALIPKIRRMFTDTELKPQRVGGSLTKADRLQHVQVLSQLVKNPSRNKMIVDDIAEAVRKGRKVMVVSERKSHLEEIDKQLMTRLYVMGLDFDPIVDFYVGGRKEHDLVKAEKANVVLATKQMVEEGLDIPAIDVLVLATPMSDVEQTVGRVRRHCKPSDSKCKHLCPWRAGSCEGKPDPIVVDVIDGRTSQGKRKYSKRMKFYSSIGAS